jgi:hypothetical protein
MRHRFRAYGLQFESDIPCPPALAAQGTTTREPDVDVTIGEVPVASSSAPRRGFEIRRDDAIFRSTRIAEYWIRSSRIVVAPKPSATLDEVRMLMFSGVAGALFHQRGRLALHGGTVARHGRAIVLLGRSGAGKSSLVAALVRRGWSYLDDNIAAMNERNGEWWVQPGLAELRLADPSAFPAGAGELAPYFRTQGKWRASAPDEFSGNETRLSAIYSVEPDHADRHTVDLIGAGQRLATLERHVFCRVAATRQQSISRFAPLARLASAIPVHRLTRPLEGSSAAATVEFFESTARRPLPID